MITNIQAVKIIAIIALSGMISACQEGHSFSSRYQHGIPVNRTAINSPRPIPVPRDKPKLSAVVNVRILNPIHQSKHITGKTLTVRKGDTIYALSRRHDVTVREIIQINNLRPPYLLYPGQKLKSPHMAVHKVSKGDTIYSLSRNYNVDMTSFARLNNLRRPYILKIGQNLTVPAQGTNYDKVQQQAALPPPTQSGKGFLWPIKGPLLSSFGPKNKGYHNDGINIAAKFGSYIRAAESGVVVHAGSKIKGFGNLILLRHSNGWITAYAHNASILVTKGQTVKKGQAIARVGQSGGVNRPQLHFEMRKGSQAVNPVGYLKS